MNAAPTLIEPTVRLNPHGTALPPFQGRWLTLSRLGWLTLVIVLVGIFIAALPLALEDYRQNSCVPGTASLAAIGITPQGCAALFAAPDVIYLGLFLVVGAVIFWHKPGDRIAFFVSVTLIFFGASTPSPIIDLAATPQWRLLADLILAFSIGIFLVLLYRFPDGRFYPRWTVPLAFIWVAWVGLWSFVSVISPFSVRPALLGYTLVALCYVSGLVAQVQRYRCYSTSLQRQQTKWIVLGVCLSVMLYIPVNFILLAVEQAGDYTPGWMALYFGVTLVHYATLMIGPAAIALSILRFRLWDIDIVINRTLLYGALTVGLGVLFIISSLIIQQLAALLTGGQQTSLAVAISALITAALFQPTRNQIKAAIDHRFYPNYLAKAAKAPAANAASPATLPISGPLTGKYIGPYELLEPIGHGGMADVYRGRQPTLGRNVAIKTLMTNLATDETFRKRFEREARAVAALRHPNIVQVFDFGEMNGLYYMVMEYVTGQDLAHYLPTMGRLALAEARPILQGVAEALDYAHAQGIIHRDVKPSNIMLQPATTIAPGAPQFRPILMDFGIARLLDTTSDLTQTGTMGTLDYIAPEQIIAAKAVDGRADQYELGIVAYQVLTGKLPFEADNAGALVLAHLQRAVPDPRRLAADLPESTTRAIQRALAKEPGERFRTVGEFVAALG